ncbi:MAG: M20/M25/M40 family metallo-hydrolase [Elusimicrobia bacterium]|nr:M20/M25/M40 family metallo-hydrolase [Elusimicrobiota bacterium]
MAAAKQVVRLAAGLALCAGSAAHAAPRPDFDRGADAGAVLEQLRAVEPPSVGGTESASGGGDVWITIGKSDLVGPAGAGTALGAPAASSKRAALYKVPADRLAELSHLMHEKFGRCGGFFAYETREEAEADLFAPPASKGGPYTLDQEAVVRPAAAAVKEGELRSTIETLAAFETRYYQSDTGVQASAWIQERWRALSATLPRASVAAVPHGWKQSSVVLTIPGSEKPDEIVVLGGHLDSISGWGFLRGRSPGADDNASGIAVLTEAIRVLAQAGFAPKRTVQFMGYSAEEVGLRGSKEIASRYAQQGKKVVGVIQFDMTNFKGSGDGIWLLEDNVDPELTAFLGKLVDAYAGVPWATTRCGYGCSDHASWTRSGFPASAAFESTFDGMNHSIHSERDTLANAGGNAAHSVPFARLAAAFAAELAKSAGTPSAHGR